jgi:hypothetical protein
VDSGLVGRLYMLGGRGRGRVGRSCGGKERRRSRIGGLGERVFVARGLWFWAPWIILLPFWIAGV